MFCQKYTVDAYLHVILDSTRNLHNSDWLEVYLKLELKVKLWRFDSGKFLLQGPGSFGETA